LPFTQNYKQSLWVDKCLEIAQNDLEILSKDERAALSILDAHRDIAIHYYQDVSEDLLYLQAQSAVTLFNDILSRFFKIKLADFVPERVLPISTSPPKDIQLLVDKELMQIDDFLEQGHRKGIQATARLRSVMALATASRENAERVTEEELRKAIKQRKSGKDWKVIFLEIAQLKLDTEGDGILFSLRIKKEGIPVRIANNDEDAMIIRDRDWFDTFNLSLNDIAEKLNKTVPKVRAYMMEVNIWNDKKMYGEKKIKSQCYKRYTQKALELLRNVVTKFPENEIWEKYKDKVLNHKTQK